MSTLPFLLSVADELDNLNSQTYMDDFGLGFHPHRHYYRNPNPSIQLSLPASTDWIEEKQRCRSHKFVDESQINCDDEGNNDDADEYNTGTNDHHNNDDQAEVYDDYHARHTSNRPDDQDNIDNTVHMYNISKKCRKYNHNPTGGASTSSATTSIVQHHPTNPNKMMHRGTSQGPSSLSLSSSEDESLQKTSTLSSLASIEFLTCFPVKKHKTPKCGVIGGSSNSSSVGGGSCGSGSNHRKS